MAVPAANKFYLAVLEISNRSNESLSATEMVERVISHLRLTEDQLQEMVPSGVKTRIEDRTQWATFHLQKAGLLERPRRGVSRITQVGREYLTINVGDIETEKLKALQSGISQSSAVTNVRNQAMNRYSEPIHSAALSGRELLPEASAFMIEVSKSETTPDEQMEASYQAECKCLQTKRLKVSRTFPQQVLRG